MWPQKFPAAAKTDTADYYCESVNDAGPPQKCRAMKMEVRKFLSHFKLHKMLHLSHFFLTSQRKCAGSPYYVSLCFLQGDLNTGGIVAGVIVALLLVALLIFAVWFAKKKGYLPG